MQEAEAIDLISRIEDAGTTVASAVVHKLGLPPADGEGRYQWALACRNEVRRIKRGE